jgi:hypothetical protein
VHQGADKMRTDEAAPAGDENACFRWIGHGG